MKGFATKAVHGPPLTATGHQALRPPVYDNVSFSFSSAQAIADAFAGKKPAHAYSRISNPTVEAFEQRIRFLAGGMAAVAMSSGMAAIANVVLALAGAGANIVTSRYLFGNTTALFSRTLAPWGLGLRCVDMTRPAELAAAMDSDTRMVFLETITNPQMEVADLAVVARIAHEKGVPVVLDNTVATPYLCRSKDFGVDIEILSSTKYISGGATSVGGIVIDNGIFDWKKAPRLAEAAGRYGPFALIAALRQDVHRNLGTCMSPHNAYLQTLGLESMHLRIEASCANALALAALLLQHPAVRRVDYPGLPDNPFYETAKGQFAARFGGVLTFDLADQDACYRFLDRLQVVRRATNINDNKTLAIHPATTIFVEFDAERRQELGVRPTMIRIATGIEDIQDLIEDITQALGDTA